MPETPKVAAPTAPTAPVATVPTGTLAAGVVDTTSLVQPSASETTQKVPTYNDSTEYAARVAFGDIVIDDDAVRKSMAAAYQNKNAPRNPNADADAEATLED